jgi:hypothetical protein
MGNNSSKILNKTVNKVDSSQLSFKDLNDNNSRFISKLDEIATTYILGQNFQDMVKLTNSKYCDDLVIITSKILKKSYFANQIQAIYSRVSDGSDTGVGLQMNEPSVSNDEKKKMCIEIAKYYVKIAHLFAAIMTTLNPVFSWKTSASSSRATLSPYVPTMSHPQVVSENEQKIGEGGVLQGNPEEVKIEEVTLENKHYISEMAKDIKVESLNFCNSRIADLIDIDELRDVLESENDIKNPSQVSEIKIKTRLCSSNLNNPGKPGESRGRKKTVYDLPGFVELSRLYNDKYNASKGRFDRMSQKSREEKKRNVDLLYTLFTGDPNPPKDIKMFRDIPLHSFVDTVDCDGVNSMLNKTYIGTTKDKLFVDYVEQIKKMIYDSNMVRNSLLEVIDSIFILNTDTDTDTATGMGERDNHGQVNEKKIKYRINPMLSYERLDELIAEARKTILKLYVNCEKNFIYTLKILQAIIESQILETTQRQIKELERNIDAEYAS